MRYPKIFFILCAVLFPLHVLVTTAAARTDIISHMVVDPNPEVFSSLIMFTGEGLDPDMGPVFLVQADVFLFDTETGRPLVSKDGTEICNPCSFSLDGETRTHRMIIDDLVENAGGFPDRTDSKPVIFTSIAVVIKPNDASLVVSCDISKITDDKFKSVAPCPSPPPRSQ